MKYHYVLIRTANLKNAVPSAVEFRKIVILYSTDRDCEKSIYWGK